MSELNWTVKKKCGRGTVDLYSDKFQKCHSSVSLFFYICITDLFSFQTIGYSYPRCLWAVMTAQIAITNHLKKLADWHWQIGEEQSIKPRDTRF